MQTVVGVFSSQETAERAIERLRALGITQEHINLLVPGSSRAQLAQVSTTETEQPGMGAALGGVVGGAVGASGSLMTTAVLSALIPGIGPVTAVGIMALSFLGLIGGAVAGATAGDALENALADGLPKDEIFVYKDALRQGRTVLIALAEDGDQAEAVRTALVQAGAERIDAVREQWLVGMDDAVAEVYTAGGGNFAEDEAIYRLGFEAALHPEAVGKPYGDVGEYLRTRYATVYATEAFRRGYARGQAYYEGLRA